MPEQPGLVETLRSKSRGSALIGSSKTGNSPGYQELQPV
nr:hypothetical protein [Salmonella enterica]